MLRLIYDIAVGSSISELRSAVQDKLDEGWMISGSAFWSVDGSQTPVYSQPLVVNRTTTEPQPPKKEK